MKKGFTLVELLSVIVILGVIGLIATPIVLKYVKESKEDSIKISLDNIERATDMYFVSNNIKQDTVIDLTSGLIELKNNNISKGLAVGNRKHIKTYIYQNGYCGIKDGNKITVKKTTIKDCNFNVDNNIELITSNKIPKDKQILGYRIYGNTMDNTSLGDNQSIILKLSGKNLLNQQYYHGSITAGYPFVANSNKILTSNKNIDVSSSRGAYSLFKLTKSNTYTFSVKNFINLTNSGSASISFGFRTKEGIYGTSEALSTNSINKSINDGKVTFTTREGKEYVWLGVWVYPTQAGDKISFDGFQLEEGTEATPYEPYLEPKEYNINLLAPLRKYGNKVDYIDSSINQIVRNVGVRADGTLYELETPTYEYIKLPSITNLDGTTIVSSSDGNISPSKLEIIAKK